MGVFLFIAVCFFSFRMEVQSLLVSGPAIIGWALSQDSEGGYQRNERMVYRL
jgi:hypothetical protein